MFLRILSRLVEITIIIGAAFIVTIVTTEVVLRYVFKHSLIFTEELSRYLMVWIVFLGSALAIRDKAHIRINILVKRLNPKLHKAAHLIAHGLVLTFLVIVAAEGIRILPSQRYQMCTTIDISLFYFYLAIPVGAVLMIVYLLPAIRTTLAEKPAAHGNQGKRSAAL
ncbi:MAG: TRAP transporter small permease [Desulfobacterales bacterium]|nr:MAG: TRAP transporter small permease [Desulfobacterales bacterium]